MPSRIAEHLAENLLQLSLTYQLAFLAALGLVLYSWIPQPKRQNTFPSWAVLEIAITSLIVARGGVLQRI